MFRKMKFYNKEKRNTSNLLANALSNRKQDNIQTGGVNGSYGGNQQSDSVTGDAYGSLLKNAGKLYGNLKNSGWFGNGRNSDAGSHLASDSADFSLGSAENLSFTGNKPVNIDNLSFMGNSGAGNIDNLSFTNLGDTGSVGGGGGFSGGSVPWGTIAGVAKEGYNSLTGKDEADYSDMEQTVAYPLQGAAMGSSFGPWGALGGALYGLGYSFKDDLGLEDNDILTDLIFPIGMGDEHQGIFG